VVALVALASAVAEDSSVAGVGGLGGVDHSVAEQVVLTVAVEQPGPSQNRRETMESTSRSRHEKKKDRYRTMSLCVGSRSHGR
jgi:hypothetical protein